MYSALIPVVILGAYLGLNAIATDQEQQASGNPLVYTADSSSSMFLTYRNAVLNYLEANPTMPSATGAIPTANLTFPSGTDTTTIGAENYVVLGTDGERTVYIWQPPVSGIAESLQAAVPGDATIGWDVNGQFITLSDQNMGTAPAYVPTGDVLSIVQLGG